MNDQEPAMQAVRQAEQHVNRDGDRVGFRNERPWGAWTLIERGSGYKVKRIEVLPGKRLSLQKHFYRSEHWIVVQGTARMTSDGRTFLLTTNQSAFIPVGAIHRLENPDSGPLVVVEVQTGTDLRESDIIRLEDDYGRVPTHGREEDSAMTAVMKRVEA